MKGYNSFLYFYAEIPIDTPVLRSVPMHNIPGIQSNKSEAIKKGFQTKRSIIW
jgi:hypothetical protein